MTVDDRGGKAPALGRRERKKLAARSAILGAATELFVELGFERTRIEVIAERADVGVGTVYNHFETKADILVAILVADVGDVVEQTRAIVERGKPDPATILHDSVAVLFDVMGRRPRNLWRDLIGHALLDGDRLGAAYHKTEAVLQGVTRMALERLAAEGNLAKRFAVDEASGIAFSLAKTATYAFVFENGADSKVLLDRLQRLTKAALPRG